MTEQPSRETIDRWHRWFAVECNNRAWSLAAGADRSAGDDRDMVNAAHAAAFHWARVGEPIHQARADLALAHVYALIGQGRSAMQYARRCLSYFEQHEGEDWDVAFAHAEMAHAAAASSDAALHAKHYAEASALGEAIEDEEDRRIFRAEFARIPDAVRAAS